MSLEQIIQIVISILTLILGALSAYFKAQDKLRDSSLKYIVEAEALYKDHTKAGGEKFSWVVETLYTLLPAPLKIIISKKCIEKIVQKSFDSIEEYAIMHLDMAVEKYLKSLSDGKSGDFTEFINKEREK